MIDESVLDRLAQHLGFRRRSDERERIDRNSYVPSFRHHHIDDKIFHRDIEHLFDVRFQSMNFVDEENISGLERVQDADDFRRFGDCISCYRLDVHLSLLRNYVCHGRLSESAGTGKQDMTHMSLPYLSAINRCFDDSFDMFLSDEFVERIRSSCVIDVQKLACVDFFHFHVLMQKYKLLVLLVESHESWVVYHQ